MGAGEMSLQGKEIRRGVKGAIRIVGGLAVLVERSSSWLPRLVSNLPSQQLP